MELKGRRSKNTIRDLLTATDIRVSIEIICQYPPRQSVNYLISFFYDTDALIRWRAIAAFGRVVAMLADENMESARVVMRRLMWNLNDESGGIGWGSPEAMGEIMAQHPKLAGEYARLLVSYIQVDQNFLEHEALQRGAIWALGRLGQTRPELVAHSAPELIRSLSSPDAFHRGYAAWALGNLKSRAAAPGVGQLKNDPAKIDIFRNLELYTTTVGSLAEEALAIIINGERSC